MERTNAQIPWPGPKPYEEREWEFFFGRDGDVDLVAQKLATDRLTVLLGVSGSGKTSLIRAGLVPLLRNRRYHANSPVSEGPVLVFRAWGARPNAFLRDLMEQQLHNAVEAIAAWHGKYPEQHGADDDVRELREVLAAHKGKDIVPTIEALAQAVANRVPKDRPKGSGQRASLILVFDQLEELLRTRDTRSERETGKLGAEILALIGELYVRDSPLRMLISMRVEYLYALRPLDRSVARLSERCHYLEAMKTAAASEVVARVNKKPGIVRIGDDILEEILKRDRPEGAESADLLRLQAMLYALSYQAREQGLTEVNDALYSGYRAKMQLDDVFQKAVEDWIESAVRGDGDDGVTLQSSEVAEKIRTPPELSDDDLRNQVRRIATRIAPHLSSSDYKVPQESNNLFRRALRQEMTTLVPERANSLETMTIDPNANPPSVNWGAEDDKPEWAQGDQQTSDTEHTSGTARTQRWSAAKTADVIAACYLLTLQRFEERNILRRTVSARNESVVWELVHDQMGPMLVRWAEKLLGGWKDCASSLVALSGGHPITVDGDHIRGESFVDLTWRGCTIQPRNEKQLTFESVTFDRCELRGIVFERCTFRGVEFNNSELNGAIFRDCIFEPCMDGAPGTDGARSLLISHDLENKLDCLLFLNGTINKVEFRNSIVRQLSIVGSDLQGEIVFENCTVAQLYASKLKGGEGEGAKVKIPASSKVWCCSTDYDSFRRLDISDARNGATTAPEPRNFVQDKPTPSQS